MANLTNLIQMFLASNNILDISAVSDLTNLTRLVLYGNAISDISALAGLTNLTELWLYGNSISDISAVSSLINLKNLWLYGNNILDISAVSGLTNLIYLNLDANNISDISAVSGLTNLKYLDLGRNNISDIFPVAGLTNLTELELRWNNISDISSVAGLTNLTDLRLNGNNISDISPVAALTNLTDLRLAVNNISDISPVAALTNLTQLGLSNNNILDISPVAGLTNLTALSLAANNISDLSPVAGLTNLKYLWLGWNNISDLSPLTNNTGLGSGDTVDVVENPLSYQSIYTHIPALQSRGVTVEFDNQAHPALLKVSGDNQTGATFAPLVQPFVVEVQDENGAASADVSVTFTVVTGGGTLRTTNTTTDANGGAQSTLTLGPNLGTHTVAVTAEGIENQVIFNANADTESPPIDADINNDGNLNVLDLIAVAASLESKGAGLTADVNRDGLVNILDLILVAGMFESTAAAPSSHPQVPDTLTAVAVQGWLTAARSLQVSNPIIKRGFIVLEQLLASLTPTETALLPNYPNPFNPETWIPYRLAADAFVTLTIYDLSGQIIRTLDVGHQVAAFYESRSKAIYWDGRNQLGEQMASGVYYYHLSAGDYAATRKMLVVK